jgi:hypothetical protein
MRLSWPVLSVVGIVKYPFDVVRDPWGTDHDAPEDGYAPDASRSAVDVSRYVIRVAAVGGRR